MSLGYDAWVVVENGYTDHKTPRADTDGQRPSNNNSRPKNAIFCDLTKSIHNKAIHCASTKEMRDKLQKPMKEMTRSREQSYRFTKDNLRRSR
jgi:hypothetical protein